MSSSVNLLLLLSAMLTALSGAGPSSRAPQVAVAVNQVAVVAADVRAVSVTMAGRPAARMPPPIAMSHRATLTRWRLTPAAPLYLSRRRE